MKTHGVLQPVIVRPSDGGTFELIAGERRWRAAQIAGLLKIPAVIREVTDDKLLELALIENLQRADLNPIEEATAYQALINDLGLSQQEAAERVGKQRATVANALRLLNLPVEVQALVQGGELTAGHAKSLAGVTDTRAQIELAKRMVAEGLSVRAVEQLVRRSEPSRKKAVSASEQRDPNVVAAEERLQSAMGTKVRIAVAHQMGNIEQVLNVVREARDKGAELPYHFIEVMACRGGCIGGGGQPHGATDEIRALRTRGIYSDDEKSKLRCSHHNPEIKRVYDEYLGEPLSHKAHELLHTTYKQRPLYQK